MDQTKLDFISKGYAPYPDALSAETPAVWGKMNAQQMIEHLADFYDVSTGKIETVLYTPEEHLPKYREFLMSEKMFRENTTAPEQLLGEEPLAMRLPGLNEAKERLAISVNEFNRYFENDPMRETLHPVFGMLNYDEWVRLHYKHVIHHLRQFSLIPAEFAA